MSALHTLAQYWVENEFIIERAAAEEVDLNGPKWTYDQNDEESVGEYLAERSAARDWHDRTMIPMHRYSCVVMLYTTAERELLRLVDNLEKERGKQKLKVKDLYAASKVEQIATFCDAFYGLRLADCAKYEALSDLQKIRDCIVHCLGDVDLFKNEKDKSYLIKLRDKRRGFFAHPGTDIYIDEKCIKQFLQEIWSFFVSVFDSLKWEVATHWHGDKLEKIFERLDK